LGEWGIGGMGGSGEKLRVWGDGYFLLLKNDLFEHENF